MTALVPGKPAYRYGTHNGETGIFKLTSGGTDENGDDLPPKLSLVLDWIPQVISYIVRLDSRKKILQARYTLVIDGHEDTIDAADLADASAWSRWPGAVGVHDKMIREVLAIVVQAQARKRTMIADAPYWDGDQLILPTPDLLPRGYGEQFDSGELPELLHLAMANPKLALVLGTSYAAPYIEPLGRQPFWLALGGTSSMGKSTALLAAASAFGRPGKKGLNRSWNASLNGVNLMLGELSVMPLFLDELHMGGFTPATLKKAVHQTCDGADRFTSSRRKRLSDSPPWYGVLFSTGNISVTGWCPQPEVAVRVVEVPAPITDSSATSKRVQDIVKRTYGWWEPIALDVMRAAIARAENLIGLPDSGGAEERIVENLALGVAGAAMLGAIKLGEEGGKALGNAALAAARDLLAIQVDELADSGQTPSEKLLEEIRASLITRPARWPAEQDYVEWIRSTRANADGARPVGIDVWGFHENGTVRVVAKYMDELAKAAGLENSRIALRELKASRHLKTGTEKGERLRQRPRIAGTRFDVYMIELETPMEAKMTGTTGTTGTSEGVSAGQPGFYAWSRSDLVPVATGTTGAGGTTETPGQRGGPGGPGRGTGTSGPTTGTTTGTGTSATGTGTGTTGARVVPINSRDRDRDRARTALAEQVANMRRVLAKSERYKAATEDQVAAAVKTFGAALDGLAFAGSPAQVGQLLFSKLAGKPGVPALEPPPEHQPVEERQVVTAFNLMDRAADVAGHRLVVGMDVNAQFLAAAGSVELGTGDPVEVRSLPEDWRSVLKLPGYVELAAPVEVGPGCTLKAGAVIANPMALYLHERDGGIPFAAGWAWLEHRRWLALWARHVRDARAALLARDDPASGMALAALKAMYAAFLGGWLNSGPEKNNRNRTDTLRPDWMHQLHSLARANALRGMGKANRRPFATLADAAYYLVDDPSDLSGLPVACGPCEKAGEPCGHLAPGKWKMQRIGRAGDQATIKVGDQMVTTGLAAQVAKGSLGNVAKVVNALHRDYQEVAREIG